MPEQSKNPLLKVLLGEWLGHPLHPAIVHVPIALWLGSLVFDVLNLCGVGGSILVRGSFWAIAGGLASTLVVVPAGIAEWTQIKRERPAWKLALAHMIMNVPTTLILLGSLILRWEHGDAGGGVARVDMLAFALNLIGNVVLLVSGYIGGRMVYEHGIGVARMSKGRWRQIAAEGGAALPPEK